LGQDTLSYIAELHGGADHVELRAESLWQRYTNYSEKRAILLCTPTLVGASLASDPKKVGAWHVFMLCSSAKVSKKPQPQLVPPAKVGQDSLGIRSGQLLLRRSRWHVGAYVGLHKDKAAPEVVNWRPCAQPRTDFTSRRFFSPFIHLIGPSCQRRTMQDPALYKSAANSSRWQSSSQMSSLPASAISTEEEVKITVGDVQYLLIENEEVQLPLLSLRLS
jgi:hypothetical protein